MTLLLLLLSMTLLQQVDIPTRSTSLELLLPLEEAHRGVLLLQQSCCCFNFCSSSSSRGVTNSTAATGL